MKRKIALGGVEWGQVLYSYICLTKLLHVPAHRSIMNAHMEWQGAVSIPPPLTSYLAKLSALSYDLPLTSGIFLLLHPSSR